MKDVTKGAIKQGLVSGAAAAAVVGGNSVFFLNGFAHAPVTILNGIFPAAAAVAGFSMGYKCFMDCCKESKESDEAENTIDFIENTELSTEEQIALLQEQRDFLTGSTEENINDRPKTR